MPEAGKLVMIPGLFCSYIVSSVARVEPRGDNDQTLEEGGIQKPLMEIMNLIESQIFKIKQLVQFINAYGNFYVE